MVTQYASLSAEERLEAAQFVVTHRAIRQAPGPSIGADRLKEHFDAMSEAENKHVYVCYLDERMVGVADVTFDPSIYSKYGYCFIENSLPSGDDRAITALITAALSALPAAMHGVLIIDQITGSPTLPTRFMTICQELGCTQSSIDYISEVALGPDAVTDYSPPAGYQLVHDEQHLTAPQLTGYYELLAEMTTDAPTGTLDLDAEVQTAADQKAFKQSLQADGRTEIATFLLDAHNTVVAFSRAVSDSDTCDSWQQLGTMVAVDKRNNGLGRLVKEVNLSRIAQRSPDGPRLRTTVDADNHGMLALNSAFGFKTVGAEILTLAPRLTTP